MLEGWRRGGRNITQAQNGAAESESTHFPGVVSREDSQELKQAKPRKGVLARDVSIDSKRR